MNKILTKAIVHDLKPLFRDGVEAANIELAYLSFVETDEDGNELILKSDYSVVRQKNINKINDKVIYILNDSAIENNEYFNFFHEPFGDVKKSRLGGKMEVNKNIAKRVRSVAFNNFYAFDINDGSKIEQIYSNGILLNLSDLPDYIWCKSEDEIAKILGVHKFETQIRNQMTIGLEDGDLPNFLRPETDEIFIQDPKKVESINKAIGNGEVFSMSRKKDGSSWTAFNRLNNQYVPNHGVCSRRKLKKLDQTYIDHYISSKGEIISRFYNEEDKTIGWINETTKEQYTKKDSVLQEFEPIKKIIRDSWVEIYKDVFQYKLDSYCKRYNLQLAISGEMIGSASSGSGNSLNSDKKGDGRVELFYLFDISKENKVKLNLSDEHNLERFCEETDLPYIKKEIIHPFKSYQEIIKTAYDFFKKVELEEGIILEGVVLNTVYTNNVSCKIMNPKYDSRK